MPIRVGSLVYCTQQGLGLLARAFHTHGIITDVLIILHGHRHNHHEWYPDSQIISNLRSPQQIQLIHDFCNQMDVMLFFETPFIWDLIPYCKEKGIFTILMPMYECTPDTFPTPDAFFCPSLLDFQYFSSLHSKSPDPWVPIPFPERNSITVFTPIPVDTTIHPHRPRTTARTFVHNAGHGGLKGRNGTAELLEALEHIKSPAKIIIRSQENLYLTADHRQWSQLTNPLTRRGQKIDYDDENPEPLEKMVEFHIGTLPYESLYLDGDVFIFPEKFNGLSLPLQEAYASGMVVMCGDRFPMNTWLPKQLPKGGEDQELPGPLDTPTLIPVSSYRRNRVGPAYHDFDEAVITPAAIAKCIDSLYDRDISLYSFSGKEWGEAHSWEVLGPKYLHLLQPKS